MSEFSVRAERTPYIRTEAGAMRNHHVLSHNDSPTHREPPARRWRSNNVEVPAIYRGELNNVPCTTLP